MRERYSNSMELRHNIRRLQTFELACFLVLGLVAAGCSTFQPTGNYRILRGSEREAEVVGEKVLKFDPLKVLTPADSSSSAVEIYLQKQCAKIIRYETPTRREDELERQPTRFEERGTFAALIVGATIFGTAASKDKSNTGNFLLVGGAAAAACLWMGDPPSPQFEYVGNPWL